MSTQRLTSAAGPTLGAGPLLLACVFSRWRFKAWRRSLQNWSTEIPSHRRGTGAWLWSFVPFTLKTASGSPIVVLLVHHLCCSGCRAGDVRRPAAEWLWVAALAAILGPREAPSVI